VAAHWAQTLRGKLSIVTVEGGITKDMEQFAGSEGSLADAVEGFATQVLCQARGIATKTGVTAVEVRTGWGDPVEVILEMAFPDNVDAIVVGRWGGGDVAG
jgi:nucleotide-binding universal stress UspA family protein